MFDPRILRVGALALLASSVLFIGCNDEDKKPNPPTDVYCEKTPNDPQCNTDVNCAQTPNDPACPQNVDCEQHPEDPARSEEHTSELQSRGHLVCRLLLEKKNNTINRQE